jgi:transcription elongation factor GreA
MSESVPMTEEGMAKLRQELTELEKQRPAIKTAIEEAREKGDLRENADYHAAREELAMLNARIAQINGMLANATLVDTSRAPEGKIVLGHTVTFRRLKDGREMTRTLVGAGQADPTTGKILTTSPMGKALIGAEVGQTVTAELPNGPVDFEVVRIA